jgi:hypothetical protein
MENDDLLKNMFNIFNKNYGNIYKADCFFVTIEVVRGDLVNG